MKNAKKFCFIICANNEMILNECIYYLSKLSVPVGYQVELLTVNSAVSMASGYNEAMKSSDAKYKIYMHQDVFILHRYILEDILKLFDSDNKIGMIGVIGSVKMPYDAVMWHGMRVGNLYEIFECNGDYGNYHYELSDGYCRVEAIDGLIMITSQDITWREDIFDGWDFYDISHSFEMKRKGFDVIVPEQKLPWCMHEDEILNLKTYNKYRHRFLQEYKELFE